MLFLTQQRHEASTSRGLPSVRVPAVSRFDLLDDPRQEIRRPSPRRRVPPWPHETILTEGTMGERAGLMQETLWHVHPGRWDAPVATPAWRRDTRPEPSR